MKRNVFQALKSQTMCSNANKFINVHIEFLPQLIHIHDVGFISLTLSTFFCCIFYFCTFESHTVKASSVCDFYTTKNESIPISSRFCANICHIQIDVNKSGEREKKETFLQTKAVVESSVRDRKRERERY